MLMMVLYLISDFNLLFAHCQKIEGLNDEFERSDQIDLIERNVIGMLNQKVENIERKLCHGDVSDISVEESAHYSDELTLNFAETFVGYST
jgi:hypothetical protein